VVPEALEPLNACGTRGQIGHVNDTDFDDLLSRREAADGEAWRSLVGPVNDDLKRIAHEQITRIAPGQTLGTTVLVHESFEKLAAQGRLPVKEKSSCYALRASAIRQIIIDHYRKRSASKRSPAPAVAADHEARRVSPDMDSAMVDLGPALDLLARRDERLLRAFETR